MTRKAKEPILIPNVPAVTPWHRARVIDYCVEEVHRQNHDVTSLDGIQRVGWLLNAWTYALECVALDPKSKPARYDMLVLGRLVEPIKNNEGIRSVGVRIGLQKFPPPDRVPALVSLLWEQRDQLSPIAFYKSFEEIHPFVDGNGRTGKVLLNWLNGTLLEPIFPPHDLFGIPVTNP